MVLSLTQAIGITYSMGGVIMFNRLWTMANYAYNFILITWVCMVLEFLYTVWNNLWLFSVLFQGNNKSWIYIIDEVSLHLHYQEIAILHACEACLFISKMDKENSIISLDLLITTDLIHTSDLKSILHYLRIVKQVYCHLNNKFPSISTKALKLQQ